MRQVAIASIFFAFVLQRAGTKYMNHVENLIDKFVNILVDKLSDGLSEALEKEFFGERESCSRKDHKTQE